MPPSPHMSQRTVPMKDNSEHRVKQLKGQRPPEKTYLACHRQGRPDPGVYHRQSTHCRKRWEDIRRWSKKMAEAQLGMASQRRRGARRTMTPLMFRILAVAYPELDGRLRASQQPKGANRPSVSKKLFLSNLDLFPTPPPPCPSQRSRTSTSATASPEPVVSVVTGIWSAPATRAASVAWSLSTDSPPPVKHQKLASARRERGKTPATKAAPRGPGGSVESAVTPSKVGKGHKKPGKSGKSSTAEKTAIIPLPRRPLPAQAQLPRRPAPAQLPRRPPPEPAQLPRRPPPAPAQLPRRPPPAQAPLGHEGPPAQAPLGHEGPPANAPLGHEGPPAKAPLGHEGPPAKAPLGREGPPAQAPLGHEGPPAKATLGHEGLPAAESLQWRPPSQASLNRAPPSQAPLNRAPQSHAPLNRAPSSHAPLNRAPPS
ncbi:hypothetical protein NDU88_002623 [Pleurodeles waltl]|uniref:Basic proline-rich protein-like n=1 Tax=Pleurodeles waltl TaxID=8319 RepID=A0AAV7T3C6_PLEWA|nr:hypothetical protein NDU88_002623 [Pleurodeles waltl]